MIAALQAQATAGVASRQSLANDFPAVAKAALADDLADDSFGERVLGKIRGLISLRRVGADIQGDSAEAKLARAEAALDAGDIAKAVELVKSLPAQTNKATAAWLARAEAHLTARRAVDQLAAHAVTLLGATVNDFPAHPRLVRDRGRRDGRRGVARRASGHCPRRMARLAPRHVVGVLMVVVVFLMLLGVAAVVGVPLDHGRARRAARRLGREPPPPGLSRADTRPPAVAAGDAKEAQKQAKKAEKLLGEPPLTLLLSAQAAQLAGDRDGAKRAFNTMLEDEQTAFLGLRGLICKRCATATRPRRWRWPSAPSSSVPTPNGSCTRCSTCRPRSANGARRRRRSIPACGAR